MTITAARTRQRARRKLKIGDDKECDHHHCLIAKQPPEGSLAKVEQRSELPLLEGTRSLSGEKIQWYLAAELRDRIRQAGVKITVIDRLARKQYAVEPRQ